MAALCRFCNEVDIKEREICSNCGYDPNTDSINQSFKPKVNLAKIKRQAAEKRTLVSSAVKKFAILAFAAGIFLILFRYNFNIAVIISKGKAVLGQIVHGRSVHTKSGKADKKNLVNNAIKLISVRSVEVEKKETEGKGLTLEGIFFVPNNKSYVIINGEVVTEGNSASGVLVNKIYEDKVEVVVNGKTSIVNVNQNIALPDNGQVSRK